MPEFYIRLLIVFMFIVSGFMKIVSPATEITRLSSRIGMNPLIPTIILLAGIWEVTASWYILYGSKGQIDVAAASLVLFTILATLLFYVPPTGRKLYALLSNITAIGALLHVMQ